MPSNEVFRKILVAFDVSLPEFLTVFDNSYAETQLRQIPDIEHWLKQQQKSQILNQRRYLYICSALIVFAITLFYAGQSKILIPEIQFQYYSKGIVLAGEPKDVFDDWQRLMPEGRNVYLKKKIEMTQRKDELYFLSDKFIDKIMLSHCQKEFVPIALLEKKRSFTYECLVKNKWCILFYYGDHGVYLRKAFI